MTPEEFMRDAEEYERSTRRVFLGALGLHIASCISGIFLKDAAFGSTESGMGDAQTLLKSVCTKKYPAVFSESDLVMFTRGSDIVLQYSFELDIMHDVPNEDAYRQRMTECVERWIQKVGLNTNEYSILPVEVDKNSSVYVIRCVIARRLYTGKLA